jgi:hypothetical protein
MLARLLRRVRDTGGAVLSGLRQRMLAATRPATTVPLARALADLQRSRAELVAENALLRQQLLILRRSIKRPRCHPSDRVLLMLLASRVRAWRQALFIVQPDTLLRWHRQLFRAFWRRQSRAMPRARRTKVSEETIQRAASWSCARPIAHPSRPASGSSARSAANVSTTSWSWARPTCGTCCGST